LNEGVGVRARCHGQECEQRLRGTRKGWHIRRGSVQAMFLKQEERQGQQMIEAI